MALPRAVQIVSGLILLGWTGLCLAGSIAVLVMEPIRNWLFTKTMGGLLLLGSVWGIAKAVSLIIGPSTPHSALVSPWVIRGFGVMFFMFPIFGLLAGTVTSWEGGIAVLFNLWVAYSLFRATADDGSDDVEEDDEVSGNH